MSVRWGYGPRGVPGATGSCDRFNRMGFPGATGGTLRFVGMAWTAGKVGPVARRRHQEPPIDQRVDCRRGGNRSPYAVDQDRRLTQWLTR